MYLVKTPAFLKKLYPELIWDIPTKDTPHIFLTFDDGPTPGITEQVLNILEKHQTKASFFCTGKQVEKHPSLYESIVLAGHTVGNHGYAHLSGWKTSVDTYLKDIDRCADFVTSPLLRPPYGRINRRQMALLKKNYRIVMWDVLSGDFDAQVSPEKCLENVTENSMPGSIIVFHDSEKAAPNMLYTLPRFLTFCQEKNWKCVGLPVL